MRQEIIHVFVKAYENMAVFMCGCIWEVILELIMELCEAEFTSCLHIFCKHEYKPEELYKISKFLSDLK